MLPLHVSDKVGGGCESCSGGACSVCYRPGVGRMFCWWVGWAGHASTTASSTTASSASTPTASATFNGDGADAPLPA